MSSIVFSFVFHASGSSSKAAGIFKAGITSLFISHDHDFPMKTTALALLFPALVTTFEDVFPHIKSEAFDNGYFRAYPNRMYITERTAISPRLNILQSDPRCNDGLYTMISLRGYKVELKGQSPMIHDSHGNLIWMNATYGETFGLSVQKYKGQDYLTFWQGDDSVGGHGEGYYYLVSSAPHFYPHV